LALERTLSFKELPDRTSANHQESRRSSRVCKKRILIHAQPQIHLACNNHEG